MPCAMRERLCEECDKPLRSAAKATRTHPGECAQKGRVRRLLEKNARQRAEEYIPPTTDASGVASGSFGPRTLPPLVPPISSVHGNVNTPGPVNIRPVSYT